MKLSAIKILFREADSMSLWGIPYDMREGQAPRDLLENPKRNWIWLGCPGWWGSLDTPNQKSIKDFLESVKDSIPGGPNEWCRLSGPALGLDLTVPGTNPSNLTTGREPKSA